MLADVDSFLKKVIQTEIDNFEHIEDDYFDLQLEEKFENSFCLPDGVTKEQEKFHCEWVKEGKIPNCEVE